MRGTRELLIGRMFGLMFVLFAGTPAGMAVSLAVHPGTDIIAAPGETVGWGYNLTNDDPALWYMADILTAGSFTNGVPVSLFDFPILTPNTVLLTPFIPNLSGIYQFTWDLTAVPPANNSGKFIVTGQFWDGDPFAGGSPVGDPFDISADYSVTLQAPGPPIPEPSTLLLLGSALGLLALRLRRR